jgi:hypothetical protein
MAILPYAVPVLIHLGEQRRWELALDAYTDGEGVLHWGTTQIYTPTYVREYALPVAWEPYEGDWIVEVPDGWERASRDHRIKTRIPLVYDYVETLTKTPSPVVWYRANGTVFPGGPLA